MTVSIVSSSTSAYQPPGPQAGFINAIEQLAQAVQSGNKPAAQQAFGALSQSVGAKGLQSGPFAQALSQIGDALKSGNLPAAQQALSTLAQKSSGRGHHHHPAGAGQSTGAAAPAQGAPSPSDATGGNVDLSA